MGRGRVEIEHTRLDKGLAIWEPRSDLVYVSPAISDPRCDLMWLRFSGTGDQMCDLVGLLPARLSVLVLPESLGCICIAAEASGSALARPCRFVGGCLLVAEGCFAGDLAVVVLFEALLLPVCPFALVEFDGLRT